MNLDDKYIVSPQEEEMECSISISEEKAEAIAVRLTEISSVIKDYVDSHPDRYKTFLSGERGGTTINPTPTYQTKFREKKK